MLHSDESTCPSRVAKIEKQLRRLPGVAAATVQLTTGRIDVQHDPQFVTVADLVAAVARAGYRARLYQLQAQLCSLDYPGADPGHTADTLTAGVTRCSPHPGGHQFRDCDGRPRTYGATYRGIASTTC